MCFVLCFIFCLFFVFISSFQKRIVSFNWNDQVYSFSTLNKYSIRFRKNSYEEQNSYFELKLSCLYSSSSIYICVEFMQSHNKSEVSVKPVHLTPVSYDLV